MEFSLLEKVICPVSKALRFLLPKLKASFVPVLFFQKIRTLRGMRRHECTKLYDCVHAFGACTEAGLGAGLGALRGISDGKSGAKLPFCGRTE